MELKLHSGGSEIAGRFGQFHSSNDNISKSLLNNTKPQLP